VIRVVEIWELNSGSTSIGRSAGTNVKSLCPTLLLATKLVAENCHQDRSQPAAVCVERTPALVTISYRFCLNRRRARFRKLHASLDGRSREKRSGNNG